MQSFRVFLRAPSRSSWIKSFLNHRAAPDFLQSAVATPACTRHIRPGLTAPCQIVSRVCARLRQPSELNELAGYGLMSGRRCAHPQCVVWMVCCKLVRWSELENLIRPEAVKGNQPAQCRQPNQRNGVTLAGQSGRAHPDARFNHRAHPVSPAWTATFWQAPAPYSRPCRPGFRAPAQCPQSREYCVRAT